MAQEPHGAPETLKKSPAPLFHAASRKIRQELYEAYKYFVAAFQDAAARLRAGEMEVLFPPGCFLPASRWVSRATQPLIAIDQAAGTFRDRGEGRGLLSACRREDRTSPKRRGKVRSEPLQPAVPRKRGRPADMRAPEGRLPAPPPPPDGWHFLGSR